MSKANNYNIKSGNGLRVGVGGKSGIRGDVSQMAMSKAKANSGTNTTNKSSASLDNKTGNKSGNSGLPPKKYRTIVSDPPWDIDQRGNYGACHHYALMSLERIKAMPVRDLVDDNAHFWLWVTNGTLRYGFDVLEAYGFTPRSLFTWVKPRYTLGVCLRNATEHLLFGTRGKAPVKFHGQASWGFYPLQDHSHKPEEVYDLIERVSEGPYLELFARQKRHGWDSWGNEVESDVMMKDYPVPRYTAAINVKGESECQ